MNTLRFDVDDSTLAWQWQNQSGQSQSQNDTDIWTEFLDGFFGRIFWTEFWTDFLDGLLDGFLDGFWTEFQTDFPTTNLGWYFCGHSTLFFGVFGHVQNPHLNFTSVWWQVGRSMSPPFEPDPFPEHARPPNRSLHNVHRALIPCVSLTLSLYLCVFLFVFWRELKHSCAREMVIADQAVHQLFKGGVMAGPSNKQCYFHNTNFSPQIPSANLQP